jgi:hypothetical protein
VTFAARSVSAGVGDGPFEGSRGQAQGAVPTDEVAFLLNHFGEAQKE